MFQVLDETPLQELMELRKVMKMPIWEYNGKYYLKIKAVKLKEVNVENVFLKTILILWIYRLIKTTFKKWRADYRL